MRRTITLIVLLFLTLSLTACAGNNNVRTTGDICNYDYKYVPLTSEEKVKAKEYLGSDTIYVYINLNMSGYRWHFLSTLELENEGFEKLGEYVCDVENDRIVMFSSYDTYCFASLKISY